MMLCNYGIHLDLHDYKMKNDNELTLPMTSTKVATRFTAEMRRMFL